MKYQAGWLAVLSFTLVIFSTTSYWTPLCAQPAEEIATDLSHAITDLESPKFRVRQAAYQTLVNAGSSAIGPLEENAKTSQRESAMRAVEALMQIAGKGRNRKVAMASLERLAKDPNNRIAIAAARAVKRLNTTDEDLAIAALTASGARISSSQDMLIVTVSSDAQLELVKRLSKIRMLSVRGQDVTDVGIDHLADASVASLSISATSVTDAGITAVRKITDLDRLSLYGGEFSTDGLRQLRYIRKLRSLSLASFVDLDLQFLKELAQLQTLSFSQMSFSKQQVELINQLKHLRHLSVMISDADNDDLRYMGQFKTTLNLSLVMGPKVNEEGWKHLAGSRVSTLYLYKMPITDGGMAVVGKIDGLQFLSITEAPVTDAGLDHLHNLKSLKHINIRGTKATQIGVDRLKDAIPNLVVIGVGLAAAVPVVPPRPRINGKKAECSD